MDPQGIQPGGFGGRTLQPAPVGGWLSEVSENCWLPPNHGFSNQITKNLDDQLGYPHDLEKTSIYHHHHHHIYIHIFTSK